MGGYKGIAAAVENCPLMKELDKGMRWTMEQALSAMGTDGGHMGMLQAVANCQAAMTFKLARDVTPET